ncbi:hypothetical protein M8C21_033121 [Ambrosia artemisiifolia]|uniref:Uncharacterized protein n=1 Tax=Ambrosia artemisiifolia TaxID=4212 RepID=A0AAD5D6I2_AMBAR|nr:hypothetical protein M8C21_033121 [Ambrosia artemisiifolia]
MKPPPSRRPIFSKSIKIAHGELMKSVVVPHFCNKICKCNLSSLLRSGYFINYAILCQGSSKRVEENTVKAPQPGHADANKDESFVAPSKRGCNHHNLTRRSFFDELACIAICVRCFSLFAEDTDISALRRKGAAPILVKKYGDDGYDESQFVTEVGEDGLARLTDKLELRKKRVKRSWDFCNKKMQLL